jgi:hypothetical protein
MSPAVSSCTGPLSGSINHPARPNPPATNPLLIVCSQATTNRLARARSPAATSLANVVVDRYFPIL